MTKAATRAQRRRMKQAQRAHGYTAQPADRVPQASTGIKRGPVRPTKERAARGVWAVTDGDRSKAPMIDRAHDMIGVLDTQGKINHSQEQAARVFQEVVAAYIADLGIGSYRSCLNDGGGGHDGGDGNIEAKRAHDGLKKRLGAVRYLYLRTETEKPTDGKPGSIEYLRRALDGING